MIETMACRGTSDDPQSWERYDNIFRDAFASLEDAGCEIAAIASVTPHARLAEAVEGTTLPVVSILDVTVQALKDHSLESAVVLGTSLTMSGQWFHNSLREADIACPDVISQRDIDEISRMLEDYFYPGKGIEGRADLLAFCHRLTSGFEKTAIILACTDFSNAFPEYSAETVFELEGMVFVDSGTAHIQELLRLAMMPV